MNSKQQNLELELFKLAEASRRNIQRYSSPGPGVAENAEALIRQVPTKVAWVEVSEHSSELLKPHSTLVGSIVRSLQLPAVNPPAILAQLSLLATHCPEPYEADATVATIMPIPNRTPGQASLYWNFIDQQVHELRVHTLSLLSGQVRRLFVHFDDRIVTASTARIILEVGLRIAVLKTFLKLAYGMLKGDRNAVNYHSHFQEVSQFLHSNTLPTEREQGLVYQVLSEDNPPGARWLDRAFEPTAAEQFAVARWLSAARKRYGDDGGLEARVAVLESAYPFLCKFVHPSPLMYRRSVRLHALTDSKIDRAVQVTATRVAAVVSTLAEDISGWFWGPCQFLDMHKMRVALGATQPYPIRCPFLSDMMDKYKPLVLPGKDGELRIFAMDSLSKSARRIGKEVEQLSDASKQRVRDFIEAEKRGQAGATEND